MTIKRFGNRTMFAKTSPNFKKEAERIGFLKKFMQSANAEKLVAVN
jgi:hypothetical protein